MSDLRDQIAEALREAFDFRIVAEWICCDPPERHHHLCKQGHAAREMVASLLAEDPAEHPQRSPILDAVMRVIEPLAGRLQHAEEVAETLRRQVSGYRGMKDTYLAERNARDVELRDAEDIITGLCEQLERNPVVKAAIDEQRQRAEQAEERLAELEGALNWQTSCLACARVLDNSIAEHERAEQAEAGARRLKGLAEGLQAELRAAITAQGQAEAAVERVRALAEQAKRDVASLFIRMLGGAPFSATLRADDVLAALDRPGEGPPATPRAEPEGLADAETFTRQIEDGQHDKPLADWEREVMARQYVRDTLARWDASRKDSDDLSELLDSLRALDRPGEPVPDATVRDAVAAEPRRLTEQQGGIPNDAITPSDMAAAHEPKDTP
jgi:hypothetical protein